MLLDAKGGRIKGAYAGALPTGESFTAHFLVKPVASSTSLNSEDNNPVFDGIKLFVQDEPVGLDPISTDGGRSGFKIRESSTNFDDAYTEIGLAKVGSPKAYPHRF